MLGQRRRRWANIGQTFDKCVVFAGKKARVTPLLTPFSAGTKDEMNKLFIMAVNP